MADDLPELNSWDDIRAFLETRPRAWSVALIHRAALRLFPYGLRTPESASSGQIRLLTTVRVQILRATVLSRFAATSPTRDMRATASAAKAAASAASAASAADVDSAAYAAAYAADAATYAVRTANANRAAKAAKASDASAFHADVAFLLAQGHNKQGVAASALLDQALWLPQRAADQQHQGEQNRLRSQLDEDLASFQQSEAAQTTAWGLLPALYHDLAAPNWSKREGLIPRRQRDEIALLGDAFWGDGKKDQPDPLSILQALADRIGWVPPAHRQPTEQELNPDADQDPDEESGPEQNPATFRFEIADGKIIARPFDPELVAEEAAATYGELRACLERLIGSCQKTNAPLADDISWSARRILDNLPNEIKAIDSNILQAALDTFEVWKISAGSEEGRAELSLSIRSGLDLIDRHLNRLADLSPHLGKVIAFRRFVNPKQSDFQKLDDIHERITFVANVDGLRHLFDQSAIRALRTHQELMSKIRGDIERSQDLKTKAELQAKLDELRKGQLIDLSNFLGALPRAIVQEEAKKRQTPETKSYWRKKIHGLRERLVDQGINAALKYVTTELVRVPFSVAIQLINGDTSGLTEMLPDLFEKPAQDIEQAVQQQLGSRDEVETDDDAGDGNSAG